MKKEKNRRLTGGKIRRGLIKLTATFLTIAALCVSATACGAKKPAYGNFEGTRLTVATNYTFYALDLFRELAESFENVTGATVELRNYGAEYGSNIDRNIGENNLPDVFMTMGYTERKFKDYSLDLTDDNFGEYTGTGKKLVSASDGKVYSFALSHELSGVLINTKVCESAGVNPESIHTWDDFFAACAKLKGGGVTPIGSNPSGKIFSEIAGSFLTYKGEAADVSEALLNGSWSGNEIGLVINFWRDCLKQEYLFPDAASLDNMEKYARFAEDQSAFLIGEDFTAAALCKSYCGEDKFLLAPYPSSRQGGEETLTVSDGDVFAINKNSKNIDCAKAFFKYLSESKTTAQLVRTTETVPALKNMKNSASTEGSAVLAKTLDYYKGRDIAYHNRWHKEYLPAGVYSTLGNVASGLFIAYDNNEYVNEYPQTIKSSYDTSYAGNRDAIDNDYKIELTDCGAGGDVNEAYIWQLADAVRFEPDESGECKAVGKSKTDKNTTVFIGDSFLDVRNWWTNFYTESYPGKNVFNMGIGGAKAGHWPFYIDRVFSSFGDAEPANIVLNIGTNDYSAYRADAAATNVETFISALRKKFPETKIYWFSVTYRGEGDYLNSDIDSLNAAVKAWIEKPEQKNVTYVDVVSKVSHDMLRGDNLHPKLETYSVFAEALEDAGCRIG